VGIKFSESKTNTFGLLLWNGQIHRQNEPMRHFWIVQNFRFSYTKLVLGSFQIAPRGKKNKRSY